MTELALQDQRKRGRRSDALAHHLDDRAVGQLIFGPVCELCDLAVAVGLDREASRELDLFPRHKQLGEVAAAAQPGGARRTAHKRWIMRSSMCVGEAATTRWASVTEL